MKKRLMALILCGVLALSMAAGCGSEEKASDAAQTTAADDVMKRQAVIEPEGELVLEENPVYQAMEGMEFAFSSGVGAWHTMLYVHKDGTFDGLYQDEDAGDTGADYPNGTRYRCSFNGTLSAPEKVDDYTYKTHITSLTYRNPKDATEVLGGVRIIYSEAYGMTDAEDIYIYLPGKSTSGMTEDFRSWAGWWAEEENLPGYAIYNEKAGTVFLGGEYEGDSMKEENPAPVAEVTQEPEPEPTIQKTLSDLFYKYDAEVEQVAEKSDEMYEKLNSGLSQAEMNALSYDIYMLWDDELNVLWQALKANMNTSDFERLRDEERAWIKDKEAAIQKEGEEWGSGTGRPLAENCVGAEWTENRVYYLLQYF